MHNTPGVEGLDAVQQTLRSRGRLGGRGSSKRASNYLQPNESVHFDSVEDSQLDHLVPLSERKEEQALRRGQDVNREKELSRDEQIQALINFKNNADAACKRSLSETVWEAGCLSQLEGVLHSQAQNETPTHSDEEVRERVIKRLDDLVRPGLMQFTGMHVETYGSYTSGLFTPKGDLDIAIEGVLKVENPNLHGVTLSDDLDGSDVATLDKDEKAALLKSLMKKLIKAGICKHRPEGIFHARVPIIKFVDSETGIPCDMAVASGGARFKSIVLKQLSLVDPRFSDLIRIVKQWAKAWNLNDAADGTFNTFALSLMVVFHLQTRSPPVLPPICYLFNQQPGAVKERPLHAGLLPRQDLIGKASEREAKALRWKEMHGGKNPESLIELFSSFFALFSHVLGVWRLGSNRDLRAIRCCSWAGEWTYKQWRKVHIFPIEDPFDTTDNCARSIFAANAPAVQQAFEDTRIALSDITTPQKTEQALKTVFEPKPKRESVHPFYKNGMGWRDGWNRRQAENEERQNGPQEQRGFRSNHRSQRQSQNARSAGLRQGPSGNVLVQLPQQAQLLPPGFANNLPPLQKPTPQQLQIFEQQSQTQQAHLRNLLTNAFQKASLSGSIAAMQPPPGHVGRPQLPQGPPPGMDLNPMHAVQQLARSQVAAPGRSSSQAQRRN